MVKVGVRGWWDVVRFLSGLHLWQGGVGNNFSNWEFSSILSQVPILGSGVPHWFRSMSVPCVVRVWPSTTPPGPGDISYRPTTLTSVLRRGPSPYRRRTIPLRRRPRQPQPGSNTGPDPSSVGVPAWNTPVDTVLFDLHGRRKWGYGYVLMEKTKVY